MKSHISTGEFHECLKKMKGHEPVALYRGLYRAIRQTFFQDHEAINKAREKLRHEYHSALQLTDPKLIEEKMTLGYQVIDFLRKNVVQAKLQSKSSPSSDLLNETSQPEITPLIYSYKINDNHEMSNNSPDKEEETKTIGLAKFKSTSGCSSLKYEHLKPVAPCQTRCNPCTCGAWPSSS